MVDGKFFLRRPGRLLALSVGSLLLPYVQVSRLARRCKFARATQAGGRWGLLNARAVSRLLLCVASCLRGSSLLVAPRECGGWSCLAAVFRGVFDSLGGFDWVRSIR